MARILLVQPFDAHAGSQRVAHAIATVLARRGVDVSIKLGFGGKGFLSEMPGVRPDIRCDDVAIRKILYPLWVLLALVPTALAALRGRTVWVNTVYSIAPAMLAILLVPKRTIIHLHEVTFPRPFHLLIWLAVRRDATLVCVSADQARRLGVSAELLPNSVGRPESDAVSRADRLLFVGTTQAIKGFALYLAVCRNLEGLALRKAAYLSDEDRHDPALVEAARSMGVEVVFGERSPDAIFADGFLVLLCTDPRLWVETFSLVAAEAVTRLVPVAGVGVTVLDEVVGEALAFNDPDRDPDRIARDVRGLYQDPQRMTELRAACAERRPHFAEDAFADRLFALLRTAGAVS